MDIRVNKFKRAITQQKPQIGFWSNLASHVSVEILAGSGFDWLLLDTEHSPNELPQVLSQLQAMMENDTQPVVRLPWNDMVVIKRFLDAGVQTLLIPTVQTRKEAEQAVASTRYPPKGVRGFASTSRSSRFGRITDYHTRCEEEICLLVQVETCRGLENLEAITTVDGVDGVFVGPGDLSVDLGYLGQPGHPEVRKVVEEGIRQVAALGKAPGVMTSNEDDIRAYQRAGCVFTSVGSDSGLLARGSEQLARKYKG